jgi:hypothetical protein
MDENTWLVSTDLVSMLEVVRGQVSDRKLRLFACACCRLIWHLFTDERTQRAVETAERYADGLVNRAEMIYRGRVAASGGAEAATVNAAFLLTLDAGFAVYGTDDLLRCCVPSEALRAACAPWEASGRPALLAAIRSTQNAQVALVRDIFGNPFRPFAHDPAWRTDPVPILAEAAYTERISPSGELDAARLVVLADALEENGADPAILAHLRGPGPHVRGCWAVDLCAGRG